MFTYFKGANKKAKKKIKTYKIVFTILNADDTATFVLIATTSFSATKCAMSFGKLLTPLSTGLA